jgi:hypothetical protein
MYTGKNRPFRAKEYQNRNLTRLIKEARTKFIFILSLTGQAKNLKIIGACTESNDFIL